MEVLLSSSVALKSLYDNLVDQHTKNPLLEECFQPSMLLILVPLDDSFQLYFESYHPGSQNQNE